MVSEKYLNQEQILDCNLSIPRDRLSLFKPMIIGILNEQEEQIKELSFELYGKGLTTREISKVLEKIYGKSYSKSTISNISLSYYDYIKSWSERKLLSNYPVIMIDALYLKVRREVVETEAFYIVLALKARLYKRNIINKKYANRIIIRLEIYLIRSSRKRFKKSKFICNRQFERFG